jgi:hypothetical protein
MGKIRSNKRAANAAYLQTTAANRDKNTINCKHSYCLLSIAFSRCANQSSEETLINRDQSVETIQALKKPDLLLKWCKTNRSSKVCH